MDKLQVEYVDIDSIKPYTGNAKEHPPEQIEQIKASIKEFGFNDPIATWNGQVVAGHGRLQAAKELGHTKIPVIKLDGLTDEQRRAYGLIHNQLTMNSGFDADALAAELASISDIDMSLYAFDVADMADVDAHGGTNTGVKGSLVDKYIEPPFSVLDARSKRWQERKHYWINDVGIKSDESRENMKVTGAAGASIPGYYTWKNKQEKILGRKLSNKEFEDNYLSKWMKDESTTKLTNTGAALSVFDPVLCEVMYKWFALPGGTVIDPFAGGSVRGIMAAFSGLDYVGVDIRKEQVEANIKSAAEICGDDMGIPSWICGDSTNIDKLALGQYDFMFSCPPYADFEKYSDLPGDISNMDYKDFLTAYRCIIKKTFGLLKDNRFAVFVVGDIRDKKGIYRNFVSDTISAFVDAGGLYYNEIILVNPIGSLPIRANKTWASKKVCKAHQNVLVFLQGGCQADKK